MSSASCPPAPTLCARGQRVSRRSQARPRLPGPCSFLLPLPKAPESKANLLGPPRTRARSHSADHGTNGQHTARCGPSGRGSTGREDIVTAGSCVPRCLRRPQQPKLPPQKGCPGPGRNGNQWLPLLTPPLWFCIFIMFLIRNFLIITRALHNNSYDFMIQRHLLPMLSG